MFYMNVQSGLVITQSNASKLAYTTSKIQVGHKADFEIIKDALFIPLWYLFEYFGKMHPCYNETKLCMQMGYFLQLRY